MKTIARHCTLLACAVLMMTACTGGKPFDKLASAMEDSEKAAAKAFKELANEKDQETFVAKLKEMTESSSKQLQKAMKSLDGTKIETEAAEDAGLTIEKGFSVSTTEEDENGNVELVLKANVNIGEDANLSNVYAFGYDGDTPVILLAGKKGNEFISFNSTSEINFDREEGTVSFKLPAIPANAEQLARTQKIVLSADKELADQMKADQEERAKNLLKNLLNGEEAEPEAKKSGEPTLNKALLGKWSNNADPLIYLELSDKKGTYCEQKGCYGYLTASNEYYETDYTLVFTSLTPDGDNIKVHYSEMVTSFTGDPDDPDGECEMVTEKVGEGDLTLIPQGGKVKIDSKKTRIKKKVIGKAYN